LVRADAVWAAGAAALATALFSTVLTSHPGLGDAPESVSGIDSFGILHAPGYPAYVVAARLFTLLEPFGDIAFRVNLFSLVCASLTVAGVYLLARRCGAARWAGALAALCLAAGAGFWFDAGFAKHNAFSGLVLLVALHLLLSWMERPSGRRLLGVGAALGVGLGASWPLIVLIFPAVGFAIFAKRRELALRSFAPGLAVGLVIVAALYGFVMVRAAQDPPVNWGRATTPERLVSLLKRSDFSGGDHPRAQSTPPAAPQGVLMQNGFAVVGERPLRIFGTYLDTFWLELGIGGIALAGWGFFASLGRRRTLASYPLLVAFLGSLIGAAAALRATSPSYDLALLQHGFLLGCYFPLACWVAVGATDVTARVGSVGWVSSTGGRAKLLRVGAPALLVAAVLVPSVIVHWPVAHRSEDPLADRYAKSVFQELPPRSVVFIWGAELTQPLIYRQLVHHDRRDVLVVAADGLSYDWYREQLAERLSRPLPRLIGLSIPDARRTVKSLRGVRPLFLDMPTAQLLRKGLGYRPVGLLAAVAPGRGPAVKSARALEARLRKAEAIAGIPGSLWREWPAEHVTPLFTTAGHELARAYYRRRDIGGMRRASEHVLRIDPSNELARRNLDVIAPNPAPVPPSRSP
jgi:hypothetical protein